MSLSKTHLWFWIVLILFVAACSRERPLGTPSASITSTPLPTAVPLPTSTPTPTGAQGTITIWHAWDDPQIHTLAQIIADYYAIYPDVQFDVLYVPLDDLLQRYEDAVRDGSGPTILLGPASWGPILADVGLVSDLKSQVSQDLIQAMSSSAMGSVRYREALVGLPYTQRGVVLYRNRKIIPQSPATFEQLVSLAKTATHGAQIGAMLERSFFFSGAHLYGIGGVLMDENGAPAFNNDKGLAWIELLRAFEQAGPTEYNTDRDVELFEDGKVGFIIEGTWKMRELADAIGTENLVIDPWPAYAGGHLSGFVQTENLYLNPRASQENQAAALKFIGYFLSEKNQAGLADIGYLPALNVVQVTDPLVAQELTALAGGVAYPTLPQIHAYNTPMGNALISVFSATTSPSDALKNAQEVIMAALTSVQITPTTINP